MDSELKDKIICALTHDMKVCQECKKCPGKDFAEIRMNLVQEVQEEFEEEDDDPRCPYDSSISCDSYCDSWDSRYCCTICDHRDCDNCDPMDI